MTKADIINRISKEQGIDRQTVTLVIEGFMKCVKDTLGRKRRAARKVQNISQHTTILLPERHVPHFKPSESFLAFRKEDNRK